MKTKSRGFALPTILIASIIMLSVLVAAISSTVAIRSSLVEQSYVQLAHTAAEAGTTYASTCLANNNNNVTWSDLKPLKPNTDCSGNAVASLSPYVLDKDNVRTYFTVSSPTLDSTGRPINLNSKGFIEVVRQSTGVVWRVWGSDNAMALSNGGDALPVGTSLDGYWSTPPSGYLLEDGSAVSRTTYSALFAVIGTTFGAGNGSTTFNLPDSRGRVAVNKSTDAEFNTLGEKYGEKTHKLTIAEMPSHTHIQNPHNHANPVAVTYGGNAGNYRSIFATNSPFWSSADWNNKTSTTTATNQYTGGDGAHNNIQPSIVVLRIIKY